jgi:DNA-binding PadR family transcriptional regulator
MQSKSFFADFFREDIIPLELPHLADLVRSQKVLNAFITLFRGGEDEVMVRLMILREIGSRAQAPRWSRAELDNHFAYVNPVKLDTVLTRLRENNLLIWEQEDAQYRLSEPGRLALAALSTLISFSETDAELGYLTAQVAAGQAMSQVSIQTLQHLLARINELYQEFSNALESQSEYQIHKAQKKLINVWQWVEKGTEVIKEILSDDTLDLTTLNQVQAIALAQSRMLNLTSTFEKRLAQLQSQRVHLGESGLNSSNIAEWLRMRTQNQLAKLAEDMILYHPEPYFVTAGELLDIAEFELYERERPDVIKTEMPVHDDAPQNEHTLDKPVLLAAEAFYSALQKVTQPTALDEVIVAQTYRETAYRLSLLSLLGDPDSAAENSVIADLVKLPLALKTDGSIKNLDHPEIVSISAGDVEPISSRKNKLS